MVLDCVVAAGEACWGFGGCGVDGGVFGGGVRRPFAGVGTAFGPVVG